MIYLITNTPKIYNDLADIIRLFYSDCQVKQGNNISAVDSSFVTTHSQSATKSGYSEIYETLINGKKYTFTYQYPFTHSVDEILESRTAKRSAKLGLYYALKSISGRQLPWGALTGIRPVSLYRQLNTYENMSARHQFQTALDVSENKIRLVEDIIDNQKSIYFKGPSDEIDVYIGIPFCPTRCLYCSFISHDLSRHPAPIAEYVDCLIKEINMLKKLKEKYNKRIRCLYFGGGTPTTLGYRHLDTILAALSPTLESTCEITVEAGRADTIDENILRVLKDNNVGRISINPQTFNDNTLEFVNRIHTVKDIYRVFDLAASYHFDSVNMDLIMGLPSETQKHMEHTLQSVKSIPVDNLTIHTLAIKRASKIKMENQVLEYAPQETVAKMVDKGRETAAQIGMQPYYLYRQKYMAGNLENVGYSMPGKQCVYNIDIMEETHNLIALGAGGISKRFFYSEDRHTRFANPKSVEHYIKNIDSIIKEKVEYFNDF
ncbi:MAG: coproporphyrinogen dehydrogenase HemZ [Clostridia bacterium]|nr:coproporphyrinogen dehydrogenase HemZ [Clostridia bacterium]